MADASVFSIENMLVLKGVRVFVKLQERVLMYFVKKCWQHLWHFKKNYRFLVNIEKILIFEVEIGMLLSLY